MFCENSGKDGESELCIGCRKSALIGAPEKGANVGCEPHFVCNFINLKQDT
jgi:hypothetical protein